MLLLPSQAHAASLPEAGSGGDAGAGEGAGDDPTFLARESVSALARVQQAIANVWERPTTDHVVCAVALAAALQANADLVELKLTAPMARRVLPSLPKLRLDASAMRVLLLCASKRSSHSSATHELCAAPLVAARVSRVASALQLTLKEPLPSRTWETVPSSKLVCVLAFHMVDSPLDVLTAVFGVLNRSDVRRCEDLHEVTCAEPLDCYTMCLVVECVSNILVA